MRTMLTLASFAVLALAPAAGAQVTNGDFASGLSGWTVATPNGDWVTGTDDVDAIDGDHAFIRSPFGGPGGQGSLTQEFDCGPDESGICTIDVTYRLDAIDATAGSAVVRIFVDGVEEHVSSPTDFFLDWTTTSIEVDCGTVELSLVLDVEPENNGWIASFDQIAADCDDAVRNDSRSWSAVKAMF